MPDPYCHEARLPFDFDDALGRLADRPTLILVPTYDRYARVADVQRQVKKGVGSLQITLETPAAYGKSGFSISSRSLSQKQLARNSTRPSCQVSRPV